MRQKIKLVTAVTLAGSVVVGGWFAWRWWTRSHTRPGLSMVERLDRVARFTDPKLNLYVNDRRAELIRQDMEAASNLEDRLRLRLQYCKELILAGKTEKAIAEIDLISPIARSQGGPLHPELRRSIALLNMVAYLRLGEQQNCILSHTAESCLFPVQGDGVHRLEEGSRRAASELMELLRIEPDSLAYRWLLNIAYMTLGEFPEGVPARYRIDPARLVSEQSFPRHAEIAPRLGVGVVGLAGGSLADDFDGDGLIDLVMSGMAVSDQMRLFHNNGDGSFVERTDAAGLTGQVGGLNMIHADYDNDGDLDIFVLRGGWYFHAGDMPNSLLRNNGDGTFADVTEEAGVLSFMPTQTAAFGDYDNDGWLDLFIGNESFRDVVHPCELYRNNGDGTFTDVSSSANVDHVGMVKAVVWGDYDNDGRLDLFLSNYQEENILYHNDGPGADGLVTFSDVTEKAGVAKPRRSFPAWFFDYNNDGFLDLLVASSEDWETDELEQVVRDILHLSNTAEKTALFENNGDGTFRDVAADRNIDKVLLAMGCNYGDIDNDGWLDCYFGTGQPSVLTLVPNRMFRNDQGNRFNDVSAAGGFGHLQKGHGISFADVDNDGDQDLFTVIGGAYSGDAYQNAFFENPGNDHHWITLRLRGVESNRNAIGARVHLALTTPGGPRSIHRVVSSGGSFGGNSYQLEIGLGDALHIDRIEVHWPTSRRTQNLTAIEMDRVYQLREDHETLETIEVNAFALNGSRGAMQGHGHHED